MVIIGAATLKQIMNNGQKQKNLKIDDKVIDNNGYTGIVTNIFKDTGQIQVQQKPNVWCTYDHAEQLKIID